MALKNQRIELTYTLDGQPTTREFDVYGMNHVDVEFEMNMHELLNGGYAQDIIGYRYAMSADLMPLLGSLEAAVWLQGFAIGTANKVRLLDTDGSEVFAVRDIIETQNEWGFDFTENIAFANRIDLYFIERTVSKLGERGLASDDGEYRILKPSYSWTESIAGNTMSIQAALIDPYSIRRFRTQLNFPYGNRGDISPVFTRKFRIDLNIFENPSNALKRKWLLEYLLWGKKQIDLSNIDPVNYADPIDVVNGESRMQWSFSNGLKDLLSISLLLLEKNARSHALIYQAPEEPGFVEPYTTPIEE